MMNDCGSYAKVFVAVKTGKVFTIANDRLENLWKEEKSVILNDSADLQFQCLEVVDSPFPESKTMN